jgi:hypothetical protein
MKKNNNFFNGIFRKKIAGISAVFLIIIILGSSVTAANLDGSIEGTGDLCNEDGIGIHRTLHPAIVLAEFRDFCNYGGITGPFAFVV